MMTVGVYAVANSVNGKVYIGSTKDFEQRWDDHRNGLQQNRHGNSHLQAAWNKYGENVFEFMICEYVGSLEQLIEREQYWLDFHRLHVDVYNILLVVGRPSGMLGKKHTKETKQKMRMAVKNRPPISEETREKMRRANLGKKYSEKTKRKMSGAQKGRKHTEEAKRRIGVASRNRKCTKEAKRKMSKSAKRRAPISEETRRRMSEAARASWARRRNDKN